MNTRTYLFGFVCLIVWFGLAFLDRFSNNEVEALQITWSVITGEIVKAEILPEKEFMEKFIRYADRHASFNRTWFAMDVTFRPLSYRQDVQLWINYLYSKFEDKELAMDIILTFTDENRRWRPYAISSNNERWFGQLLIDYHRDFVTSKRFGDPYNQIDYLVDIYRDRQLARRHWKDDLCPREGRKKRDLYRDLFTLN